MLYTTPMGTQRWLIFCGPTLLQFACTLCRNARNFYPGARIQRSLRDRDYSCKHRASLAFAIHSAHISLIIAR